MGTKSDLERMKDAAEYLWMVLATVGLGKGRDWSQESQVWQHEAATARDEYHALCKELKLKNGVTMSSPNIENEFARGADSMVRSCLAAVELIREGRWTLDRMEGWLKSIIRESPGAEHTCKILCPMKNN